MAGIEARFRVERPDFSLDVAEVLPSRGVTALFGPSGSGKTTLLRCLAGLEHAAGGRLVVDGEIWQDATTFRPTHERPIGYVFQEPSLFAHLSVRRNLEYGQRRAAMSLRGGLDTAVELLGIGDLLERRPDTLSGGERQRVAIARALAVGPRLLLMDEPLAALDLARKREILPYLQRLHDELDIPLIYVSHSPDEVVRLADHLVLMDAGRVRASGPLSTTLARLDPAVRLGDDAGVVLPARVGALDAEWRLARIDFDGGALWAADRDLALGAAVRIRVLARDVSLAVEPGYSSIQNVLRGRVDALGDDEHPGLVLVRVQVGASLLLARLTRRAAVALGVEPGRELWVQVKAVALAR